LFCFSVVAGAGRRNTGGSLGSRISPEVGVAVKEEVKVAVGVNTGISGGIDVPVGVGEANTIGDEKPSIVGSGVAVFPLAPISLAGMGVASRAQEKVWNARKTITSQRVLFFIDSLLRPDKPRGLDYSRIFWFCLAVLEFLVLLSSHVR